ncbi:MAG: hypothetical protein ACJ777_08865, partial [Chloroflexota bacterium]
PLTGPDRLERGFRSEPRADPDEPVADRLTEGRGWLTALAKECSRGDLSLDPLPGQLADQLL